MGNNIKRIEWLDVAKGMAIILVVLGHSALPAYANRFIFAFHMPFFFFASGYSSDFNKYRLGEYVGRKAKVLLIPFVVYSFFNLILQPYVSDLSYPDYWLRFIKEGWMGVPLWFVPVLFLALIVTRLVYLIKKTWLFWIVVILLPCISITFKLHQIGLPWNLSVMPYASFLIILGNMGGKSIGFWEKCNTTIGKTSFMLVCLVATCLISYFWKLDLCWNNILPFIPLLVGAITGSLFLSLFAMLIVSYSAPLKKMLQGIGKETFLILALAEITIVYLNYFFTLNSAVKYVLLIVIMYALYWVKKGVLAVRDAAINKVNV